MPDLETDKLMESFSLRIPEITKHMIDELTPNWKRRMNEEILLAIARVLHESRFDASVYLKS